MAFIDDPQVEAAKEARFDNAGPKEMKIKELEEGIVRADENIKLFTEKTQEQIILKTQLETELRILRGN